MMVERWDTTRALGGVSRALAASERAATVRLQASRAFFFGQGLHALTGCGTNRTNAAPMTTLLVWPAFCTRCTRDSKRLSEPSPSKWLRSRLRINLPADGGVVESHDSA